MLKKFPAQQKGFDRPGLRDVPTNPPSNSS